MTLTKNKWNLLVVAAIALLGALPLVYPAAFASSAYTVRKNESLSEIAVLHGVTVKALTEVNKLRNPHMIRPGQVLRIPVKGTLTKTPEGTYTVRKGETLETVAAKLKTTVAVLKKLNKLKNPDKIFEGQSLKAPSAAARPTPSGAYIVKKGETVGDISQATGASVGAIIKANNLKNPNRIYIGQRLIIPGAGAHYSLSAELRKELDRARVSRGRWRHIVIHHSATPKDSAENMDRYHREEQNMPNGLAYHFVIGNGHRMKDGGIHIGQRWQRQLPGGHLRSDSLNRKSIGICLVGDFNKTRPTKAQMRELHALVSYLTKRLRLSAKVVTTHTLIHPNWTACPGARFPTQSFLKELKL